MQGSNGDTDIENKFMDSGGGVKESVEGMERVTWKLILPYVKHIAKGNLLCDSGNRNQGSVTSWRDGMGRELGVRFKREGTLMANSC